MRFTTAEPNGPAVQIALTTGHTAIVLPLSDEPEGVELAPMFRKEAISRGCVPVGISTEEKPTEPSFDRKQVIKDAVQTMLEGDDANAFTADGKPDLRKLNALVGFSIERSERDAIWTEFEGNL